MSAAESGRRTTVVMTPVESKRRTTVVVTPVGSKRRTTVVVTTVESGRRGGMIVTPVPQGNTPDLERMSQKTLRDGGPVVFTTTDAGSFNGERLWHKISMRKLRAVKSAAPVVFKGAVFRFDGKPVYYRKDWFQYRDARAAAAKPDDLVRARARLAALAPGFTDDLRNAPPFPAGVPEILGGD